MEVSKKEKYYYFYGGMLEPQHDYKKSLVRYNQNPFDENFTKWTIKQMIKYTISCKEIDIFSFNIDSIQRKQTYSFDYCVTALIKMRNKIAHKLKDISFSDEDTIEVLSMENIIKKQFESQGDYDLAQMDDITKHIASNLVYLDIIIKKVECI